MSVADRMAKLELMKTLRGDQGSQTEESTSSTLVLRDSPVIRRLGGLVEQLAEYQSTADTKFAKMGFMLKIVCEELFDEIREYDEITFSRYLVLVARITEWVATGDLSIIPDELRPMLAKIDGLDLSVEVEEITANA